jgi:hypothetical protein
VLFLLLLIPSLRMFVLPMTSMCVAFLILGTLFAC